MESYELRVEGMSGTGCEETVTNGISRVAEVHRVDADHETNRVDVTAEDGANMSRPADGR